MQAKDTAKENQNLLSHFNERNDRRDGTGTLRQWNPLEEVLMNIHVPKCAGTSLDNSLELSIMEQSNCSMKCVWNTRQLERPITGCESQKPVFCKRHFDWSLVAEVERMGYQVAPMVMLRNPIERAVSYFYFLKSRNLVGKDLWLALKKRRENWSNFRWCLQSTAFGTTSSSWHFLLFICQ